MRLNVVEIVERVDKVDERTLKILFKLAVNNKPLSYKNSA